MSKPEWEGLIFCHTPAYASLVCLALQKEFAFDPSVTTSKIWKDVKFRVRHSSVDILNEPEEVTRLDQTKIGNIACSPIVWFAYGYLEALRETGEGGNRLEPASDSFKRTVRAQKPKDGSEAGFEFQLAW